MAYLGKCGVNYVDNRRIQSGQCMVHSEYEMVSIFNLLLKKQWFYYWLSFSTYSVQEVNILYFLKPADVNFGFNILTYLNCLIEFEPGLFVVEIN